MPVEQKHNVILTYTPKDKPHLGMMTHAVSFFGTFEDEILGGDVMVWREVGNKKMLAVTVTNDVYEVKGFERKHVGSLAKLQ